MGDNIAMTRQGHQFSRRMADGSWISLSWPRGGEREVITLPPAKRTRDITMRIAEGIIEEVDLPATSVRSDVRPARRVLTGEAAREHFEIPAGPVVRRVFTPAGESEEVQVPEPGPKDPFDELLELSKDELTDKATDMGLTVSAKLTKAEIANLILAGDDDGETPGDEAAPSE